MIQFSSSLSRVIVIIFIFKTRERYGENAKSRETCTMTQKHNFGKQTWRTSNEQRGSKEAQENGMERETFHCSCCQVFSSLDLRTLLNHIHTVHSFIVKMQFLNANVLLMDVPLFSQNIILCINIQFVIIKKSIMTS